ncbi:MULTISPECIES: hypothetical protein [Actinoalloteichus]|uniref:Uncharacterized protein n=1 Tax=Actinoalloteichus fjordicus TaxID=1612552 RepID=A0AAC9LG28_9PSEU|nr:MULTISPECIES: hypothetical protein [Actinoalloteichus]APU17268.1 hypothetical protein UA74_26315 [Actinoalloteichus fjordicus]APU23351.1 hypothetical protein UA75_26900 [Actinoalloteichus sp. GBA129-24]
MTQHDHAFPAGRRASDVIAGPAPSPRVAGDSSGRARPGRAEFGVASVGRPVGPQDSSARPLPPRPLPPRPTPPRPTAPWPRSAADVERRRPAPGTVDEALDALTRRRFIASRAPGDDQVPFTLLYTYGWPGHVDAVHLRAEDDATAVRFRSSSCCGAGPPLLGEDDLVWRCEGDFLTVVGELIELPEPGDRGAPERALRVPSGLWIPRTADALTFHRGAAAPAGWAPRPAEVR